MDRRKGIALESYASIREHKKWTTDMDFRLLNAMIDETSMGNHIDDSWMTQGYTNIVKIPTSKWIGKDYKKSCEEQTEKTLRIDGVRSMIYLVD